MERSKYLNTILDNIRLGKFRAAHILMKKNEVSKHHAIKIICCMAKTCDDNLRSNLQIDHHDSLFSLFISAIKYIASLEKTQLVPYLQSVFHICKFFIEKECFEHISRIEHVIVLQDIAVDGRLVDTAQFTYEQLINMLVISVNKLLRTENNNYFEYLADIIKIILKAKMRISCALVTLNFAKRLVTNLFSSNVKIQQLQKIYTNILDICIYSLKEIVLTEHMEVLLEIYSTLFCVAVVKNDSLQAMTVLKNINIYVTENLHGDNDLCVYYHKLFADAITIITPINKKESLNLDVKKQFQKIKKSNRTFFDKLLIQLIRCIYHLMENYSKNEFDNWDELDTKELIHLQMFLKNEILLISDDSSEKNWLATSLIAYYLSIFLTQHVKDQTDVSEEFCRIVLDFIEHLFKILERLKSSDEARFANLYQNSTKFFYHFGIVFSNKDPDVCLECFKYYLKKTCEFTQKTSNSIKLINASVNMICSKYYDLGNYEMSLAYAALQCLLHVINSEEGILPAFWTRAKEKLRSKPLIHKLTMVEVLEQNSEFLKSIINPLQYLTKENKIKILRCELRCYFDGYKSKIPIALTFTQLYQLSEIPELINIIIDTFGNSDINLSCESLSVLYDVHSALEKHLADTACQRNKNIKGCFALGIISYIYYRTLRMESVIKSLEDVDRSMKFVEDAKQRLDAEPVPKDHHEACDIVSVYQNLELNQFIDVLEYLNQALKHFVLANDPLLDKKYKENLVKLLINVGHEYRLQGFSFKSISAFNESLNAARMVKDYNNQLLSIAYLIESANVKRDHVKLLIEKGDELAQLLQDKNVNMYRSTLISYYVFKTNAFLYSNIEISYESWQKAKKLYDDCEINDTDSKFLYCKILILQFKFMTSSELIAEKYPGESAVLKVHDAMNIVVPLTCQVSSCINPFQINIAFEVMHTLTRYYLLTRLPRDLRMYSKNSIVLAQKLVLPMTTVSFLILLANCDILTVHLDDGDNKLNGVKQILYFDEKNKNNIDIVTDQIEKLTVGDTKSTQLDSPTSTYLVPEHFKLPNFLLHDKNCICLSCMSMEIQHFWLQLIHLKALKYIYGKNEQMANYFIKSFSKVFNDIQGNQNNLKSKLKQLVQKVSIPTFNHISLETYLNFANDYSLHLSRSCKYKEALDINSQCITLIEERQNEFTQLYTDTLIHRLTFIKGINENNKPMKKPLSSKKFKINLDNLKTPLNGKSSVAINPYDIETVQKNRHLKKCALFKTPKEKLTNCETPFCKPLALPRTPLPERKTPSVPKIALFNENGVQIKSSTSKSKPSDSTRKPKVDHVQKSSSKSENRKHKQIGAHSIAPAALLREELKKSIKKAEIKVATNNNDTENLSIIANSPEEPTSQRVTRSLARQLKAASEKKKGTKNYTDATSSCRKRLL